jgi:hypothetical protein
MDPQTEARLRELRKELAEVEAKITELTSNPPLDMPTIDLKAEVLAMSDNKEWKDFIIKQDVIYNITNILDECYDAYKDCMREDFPNLKPKDLIGKLGSNKWLNFQLKTIKKLLDPPNMNEDFQDTAGGCDEVAWDAGLEVIQELAA